MGPLEHDWQFDIVEQETHSLGADKFIKILLTDKSKAYPETHEPQIGPSLHVWQLGIAQETHIFVTNNPTYKYLSTDLWKIQHYTQSKQAHQCKFDNFEQYKLHKQNYLI